MNGRMWQRADIEIGDLFLKGGRVYRVAGIVDYPQAILVPVQEPDDSKLERYHYVIQSPLFSEFDKLTPTRP